MGVANYTELVAQVSTQLSRVDVTAQVPTGLALTEAKVNRALDDLQMETRYTATATEYMALPSGFVRLRDIQLNLSRGNKPLKLMTPAEMDRNFSTSTGEPVGYCLLANQIQLAPSPDSGYTVEICAVITVPALTSSASTNWLLTNWPDVYLYGACFEVSALIKDIEAAQGYRALFQSAMGELVAYGKRQKSSGPPLVTRPG